MSKDIEMVTVNQKIGYEDIGTISEGGIKKWLSSNLGRFVADNLDELPITYIGEEEREGIIKKIRVNIVSDRLYSYIKRNEEEIMEEIERRESNRGKPTLYNSEAWRETIERLTPESKKEKE